MQVQSLRIPSYRRFKVDDTLPAAAVKRRHKLETYRDLRGRGLLPADRPACHRLVESHLLPLGSALPEVWPARLGSDQPASATHPPPAMDASP